MAEQYANTYETTLDGAINNSQTTLTLISATGAPDAPFRVKIDDEIIYVGARTGTACSSCTRGAEGSVAASHSSGADIRQVLTVAGLKAIAGHVVQKGTFASLPASSQEGNVYLPTDAWQIFRDSGSAQEQWGPIFPLTVPITTGWSWVNQGTSTIATTKNSLILTGGATGSGANVSGRFRTAPATPWTVTIHVIPTVLNKAFMGYGLAFRQASDGKLHTNMIMGTGTSTEVSRLMSSKWDSPTVLNAHYQTLFFPGKCTWFRVTDDGSNRKSYISGDGQNWMETHSIGRTDYLTATEVGFLVSTENSATPNLGAIMNIDHLAIT